MKKYVAGAGVAVALLTGSIAVAAVSPIGFAGAQDSTTTEPPSGEELVPAPPGPDVPEMRNGPLEQSLDELVAEGVITQEQADAITSRVGEKAEQWKDQHPRMGHGGFDGLRESAQAVADALGMSVEELTTALRDGSSLNDLATEKGVDPTTISQILIDAANARIDEAVTDGKLDQEKADELKAGIADNIGKVMDGSLKGLGGFGHGPGGRGAPGAPGGDDDSADTGD